MCDEVAHTKSLMKRIFEQVSSIGTETPTSLLIDIRQLLNELLAGTKLTNELLVQQAENQRAQHRDSRLSTTGAGNYEIQFLRRRLASTSIYCSTYHRVETRGVLSPRGSNTEHGFGNWVHIVTCGRDDIQMPCK